MSESEHEEQHGPTVRDRRRIDPETFQVREPQPAAAPAGPDGATSNEVAAGTAEGNQQVEELQARLNERTADLQRLQAEYVNYKRRVDRDRDAARELVTGSVLTELLGILDDIGRGREGSELEGAFKAGGQSPERGTGKAGPGKVREKGGPL